MPESSPICHLYRLNHQQKKPQRLLTVNISTNKVHFQSKELGHLKHVLDSLRWDPMVPYLAVGLLLDSRRCRIQKWEKTGGKAIPGTPALVFPAVWLYITRSYIQVQT